MSRHARSTVLAVAVAAAGLLVPPLQAQVGSPTAKPIQVSRIRPVADARVQANVSTNFADGDLVVGLPDKVVFIRFPVRDSLPAGATIVSAELSMAFRQLSEGSNPVEVGRIQAAWGENSINAVNQPAVSWLGVSRTVSPGATVRFDVTDAVRSMLTAGGQGLALRGDGPLMYGYSRETAPSPAQQPTLDIRYIVP